MKDNNMKTKLIATKEYLLLIDTGAEIRGGDYNYCSWSLIERQTYKVAKIVKDCYIDTENYGHIKKGGQYMVSKILAYYPLTSEAKELDLPLLPNPFEEINIEDLSEKANGYAYYGKPLGEKYLAFKEGFIEGYKAAQPKQFSLEDVRKAIEMATRINPNNTDRFYSKEEIIQSLSTQTSLPKIFIPEYEFECCNRYLNCKGCDATSEMLNKRLKTITNSEGKEEIQGTYKY